MSKVKLFRGPASRYEAGFEAIHEFSDGKGNGGLLSLRTSSQESDRPVVVEVYRTDAAVAVMAPVEAIVAGVNEATARELIAALTARFPVESAG